MIRLKLIKSTPIILKTKFLGITKRIQHSEGVILLKFLGRVLFIVQPESRSRF